MPRAPKSPFSAYAAQAAQSPQSVAAEPLTPSDRIFLDEVERLLHLALDRLGTVIEEINPPTKYDYPAPGSVPHDYVMPKPKNQTYNFIPHARELLRSVRALMSLCSVWALLRVSRNPKSATHDQSPNPVLLSMVNNLATTLSPPPAST